MKKNLIPIYFFYFIVIYGFAQQHVSINHIQSRLITNEGIEFIGELMDVNDDLYAFDSWDNEGIIFIKDKQYSLGNLNFNVTTNKFNSRIKRDQLFLYNTANIDAISINNHLFKKMGDSFYEVLYEDNGDQLLKRYDVKYKAGSVSRLNGSVGKPTVSLEFRYLINSEEEIKMIELTKKSIMNLMNNAQNMNIFESFVESENLSYRKEDDTIRMIAFILKNS